MSLETRTGTTRERSFNKTRLSDEASIDQVLVKVLTSDVIKSPRPVLVSLLNNKGVIYIERRQYAQATKSLSRALRMAEKETQVDDLVSSRSYADLEMHWPTIGKQLTSVSMTSMADIESSDNSRIPFKHRAEYDEGMDYFRNPLRLSDASRSIDGTILFNLARVHHNQGNYGEALSLYKRSLRAVEKWPILDEALTLAILFGIGQIQYIRGDHADSLKTYMTSLKFSKSKFGANSLEVAACLNCIGVLHYIMPKGDSETALDALKSAIRMRIVTLGENHIDVGTAWNNIGRIYFQQGKYDKAMDSYSSERAG
jgi:tetratricopeptide (TPR) repeat protein